MLNITIGKGRNKERLSIQNLTRTQLHCMTELTQLQMFGEVLYRRPSDRSIHPYGRKRLPRNQWLKVLEAAKKKAA
jgi:hypothetical protein